MPFGGLLVGGIVGGVTNLIGGAMGSSAASNAAAQQAQAALQAAALQSGTAQNIAGMQLAAGEQALGLQAQGYNIAQANQLPFLQTGAAATANLASLLGIKPQGNMPVYNPLTVPALNIPQMPKPGGGALGVSNGIYRDPTTGLIASVANGQITPMSPEQWSAAQASGQRYKSYAGLSGLLSQQGPTGGGGGGGMTIQAPTTAAPAQGAPLANYVNPQLGGFGSLAQGWNGQVAQQVGTPFANPQTGAFVAPTSVTEQNDPGYAFRLAESERMLQQSAAAQGNLLSGAEQQALMQYGQNYASNEYQNVYNRALQQYQQSYNQWQQNQTNLFNRMASLSGYGQTSAQQLGSAAQGTAGAMAGTLGSTAAGIGGTYGAAASNIGQALQNAGAARASGLVGGANAWQGALGGIGSNIGQFALMNAIGQGYFNNAPGASAAYGGPTAPGYNYGSPYSLDTGAGISDLWTGTY